MKFKRIDSLIIYKYQIKGKNTIYYMATSGNILSGNNTENAVTVEQQPQEQLAVEQEPQEQLPVTEQVTIPDVIPVVADTNPTETGVVSDKTNQTVNDNVNVSADVSANVTPNENTDDDCDSCCGVQATSTQKTVVGNFVMTYSSQQESQSQDGGNFTTLFKDYMRREIARHQKNDDATKPQQDPDEQQIRAFFREFEFQFSNNKLNLCDSSYECGLRTPINDKIKTIFIKEMQQFGFTFVDSFDSLDKMSYTITTGEPTDRFQTTVFLNF